MGAGRHQRRGPRRELVGPDQHHPGGRGVVRTQRARGGDRAVHPPAEGAAQDRLEALGGQGTEPDQDRVVAGAVDDRRLDPDPARAAVEDHVDVVAQVGPDVVGRGRADPPEPVGGRGGDPAAETAQQPLGERLVRHPDADRVAPAGDLVGHRRVAPHQEGQRPRPARLGEDPRRRRDGGGPRREELVDARTGREVHDDRMRGRSALHRVEALAARDGCGRRRRARTRSRSGRPPARPAPRPRPRRRRRPSGPPRPSSSPRRPAEPGSGGDQPTGPTPPTRAW